MDLETLLECREDMGELFADCIEQTLEYHLLILDGPGAGGSTINADFGFIEERDEQLHPKTQVFPLHFTMVQKAHRAKKLRKPEDEWVGDYDCRVFIPTQDLVDQSLTLDRDHSFLRLPDGTEWRIEAIRELPKTGQGSIITVCYCSKRKPAEDNPGGYG